MAAPLVVLVIFDGWGLSDRREGNAIALARLPHFTDAWEHNPHGLLWASGRSVGLPDGQMGNSEVGHMNFGAGHIVYQDITRIDKAIEDGSFFSNPAWLTVIDHVTRGQGTLHLMGLVSDGGVHSSLEHLLALIRLAAERRVPRLALHAFLDGRDTPPRSALAYLARVEAEMAALSVGAVATVMGRYYAMDRDTRWDRVERAYQAMTGGIGAPAASARAAVEQSYAQGADDEFVAPSVIQSPGHPPIRMQDQDGVIFFNFRPDRAREITKALVLPAFDGFARAVQPALVMATMTSYEDGLPVSVAYPQRHLSHTLGEMVSAHGLKQLRIAETEKYAHVTYFFSGGREQPFPGEDRVLIPSPRVATYDLQPEMNARQVTDEAVARIQSGAYALVVLNYANADMVGHSGSVPATIKAVEAVDECLGRVLAAAKARGGTVLITADHGNAEQLIDPATGLPHTAHTTNPVPLILVSPHGQRVKPEGILADVAPTVLQLLGIPPPPEMDRPGLLA